MLNQVKRQFAEYSGEYLPLSAWAAKNFNATMIEKNGKKARDPILECYVYQLENLKDGSKEIEDLTRSHMCRLLKKGKGAPECIDDAAPEIKSTKRKAGSEEKDEGEDKVGNDDGAGVSSSQSSSSTSLSTSSSSSSPKKKKKDKKNKHKKAAKNSRASEKKEKKTKMKFKEAAKKAAKKKAAAEKAAAAEAASEKRRKAKLHADSARMLSKVTPILVSLQNLHSDEMFKLAPKPIRDNTASAMKNLKSISDNSNDRLRGATAEPHPFSLEEASTHAKQGG